MLVAFETGFDTCSVALLSGSGELIGSDVQPATRKHTELLLPMLDAVLEKAAVEKTALGTVAFNAGPGAFTGLRINTACAQGLAYALNLNCTPVGSLHALAYAAACANSSLEGEFCVVIDARMNEWYAAKFKLGRMTADSQPSSTSNPSSEVDPNADAVADSALVQASGLKCTEQPKLVGEQSLAQWAAGLQVFCVPVDQGAAASLLGQVSTQSFDARHIAQLGFEQLTQGLAVSADQAQPVYLRHNAWKTLAEQKKTST